MEDAPLSVREAAWALYEESFPRHERRSRRAHQAACADPEFHGKVAYENKGELLAILFYWIHDDLLFIEHLAVHPALRGRNIGSLLLGRFVSDNPGLTVILEIDPPIDEISRRREGFYQRLGFVTNGYEFIHPSYSKGEQAHPHPLVIMSHGRGITPQEFEGFTTYLNGTLLRYTD